VEGRIAGGTYPEGKVGESAVCHGFEQEQGATDLLRIHGRFARFSQNSPHSQGPLITNWHTVHSATTATFFSESWKKNARKWIDERCGSVPVMLVQQAQEQITLCIRLETYRLGVRMRILYKQTDRASVWEPAARAALMRLTAEEEEIQQNCGRRSDLFFPGNLARHQSLGIVTLATIQTKRTKIEWTPNADNSNKQINYCTVNGEYNSALFTLSHDLLKYWDQIIDIHVRKSYAAYFLLYCNN
jgi:hypothetical protein